MSDFKMSKLGAPANTDDATKGTADPPLKPPKRNLLEPQQFTLDKHGGLAETFSSLMTAIN